MAAASLEIPPPPVHHYQTRQSPVLGAADLRALPEPAASDLEPPQLPTIPRHPDEALISQLGRLASQHHASEYNRLKFGPNGSPLHYVPYSVQLPDEFATMQAHQSRCAEVEPWWLCRRRQIHGGSPPEATEHQQDREGRSSSELRDEIFAAMSSPLVPGKGAFATTPDAGAPSRSTASTGHYQTSETHPIVISTVIPPELISMISSHLVQAESDFPVMFTLPPGYFLDRITPRVTQPAPPKQPHSSPPPPYAPILHHPPSASHITKSLKLSNLLWVHPAVRRAFSNPLAGNDYLPTARALPPHKDAAKLSKMDPPTVPRRTPAGGGVGSRPPLLPRMSFEDTLKSFLLESPSLSTTESPIPAVPSLPPVSAKPTIGDLYMSSCPGKKVRLDGPVKGRGAVCRDVRTDMSRIKNVGVRCIVCCLDDDEMRTIGVSWAEYAEVADELELDVLRIPVPEGLAPTDPALLDRHLTKLISDYTMSGSAVLVHCRGGVGRAGLIACCWIIKLGLCGWIETDPSRPATPSEGRRSPATALARRDTLRLVENVIGVVRRRRSPKAIETYEQVKFLVEYVEYLRASVPSAPIDPSLATDVFADWDTRVD